MQNSSSSTLLTVRVKPKMKLHVFAHKSLLPVSTFVSPLYEEGNEEESSSKDADERSQVRG